MSNLFYRNPRLLMLAISLIVVAGVSSYSATPRMEDPLLTERAANVNTFFPGASAERVESLVTEKLEEELREIEEIKELRSTSRAGVSTIAIELRDDIYEVDNIWSRIRDRLDDAAIELPSGAAEPDFDQLDVRAYALIVALSWRQDSEPNIAVLRRLTEDLEDLLKGISGTEKVETFGDPDEEVLVQIRPANLASMNLTAGDVAQQIASSDAKVAAGQLRASDSDLLLEVDGELDSLARIAQTPIRFGGDGQFVQLGDIADVTKSFVDPPDSLAIVDGAQAISLGVLVRNDHRIDLWSQKVQKKLETFESRLPRGVSLDVVFEQNSYVETRLNDLVYNLMLSGIAVVVVIFFMMGWRSALLVSSALPLTALMVLAGMRMMDIPIHQMSVTGLIIALGLLIDNAIVIVDEVTEELKHGVPPFEAVSKSVQHLFVPLLGSTLTTALAFAPIAIMPGPAGEFVGAIAVSVILAIISSFLLAMTVTPALTALMGLGSGAGQRRRFWADGFANAGLTAIYQTSLRWIFARPLWGLALGVALPLFGFFQARHLSEQFFPPADRDQINVELEMPAHASMAETESMARRVRSALLAHDSVTQAHWFLGESAPTFYYNVIPRRKGDSRYAQAIVQLESAEGSTEIIHELQAQMDQQFPEARILVRQLEQGPPFDAPVEVRLFGPSVEELQRLGDRVRKLLVATPNVVHTRAEMSEALPKLSLQVDEEQARLVGLDHLTIARQLESSLEGAVGGSFLEGAEELPVRVRVGSEERGSLSRITSLDLLPPGARVENADYRGVPLSSVAEVELEPEVVTIPHLNGRRMNEVQAFITAGVLPADVVNDFRARLKVEMNKAEDPLVFPPGYTLEYGGEAAKRDEAVGNLMAKVSVLMVLMVATLVLSFSSFRVAALVGAVAALSVGLGLGALWVFGYPFGFMAIVGSMGLVGIAINDAIVVLAAIRADEAARIGDREAVQRVVLRSTRHIVATSLTTMAGFAPLVLGGGGFWPPLAIAIAGGVGGATILALYFIPSAYLLVMCRRQSAPAAEPAKPETAEEPQLAASLDVV